MFYTIVMNPIIIYATSNPGKFEEVSRLFQANGLQIQAPTEYGVELKVEETGSTLEQNATLKAEAYLDKLPPDSVVIGDDTGVEIDSLGGEPGIRVRRWAGYKMSDQEIIDFCLKRMENVPKQARFAQFRTVIAVAANRQATQIFSGILPGHIVEKPTPLQIAGFPFESLFYADEYQLMLGDIHQLSLKEKLAKNLFTHRERAVISALPYLRQLLDQTSHSPRE